MDLVALVVAFAAFAVSILATWAALRQAAASEQAVTRADEANQLARTALEIARSTQRIEADRQHVELAPVWELEALGNPDETQNVRLTNRGPIAYDRITVRVAPGSERLIAGFFPEELLDPLDEVVEPKLLTVARR